MILGMEKILPKSHYGPATTCSSINADRISYAERCFAQAKRLATLHWGPASLHGSDHRQVCWARTKFSKLSPQKRIVMLCRVLSLFCKCRLVYFRVQGKRLMIRLNTTDTVPGSFKSIWKWCKNPLLGRQYPAAGIFSHFALPGSFKLHVKYYVCSSKI